MGNPFPISSQVVPFLPIFPQPGEMPFLYFIPTNATQVIPDDIDRLGLGYAIDKPTPRGCTGPERQRGFAMRENPDNLVNFNRDSQTWVPAPKLDAESPPYWVGWESLPTPEDLQRAEQVPGDWVTLVDGSKWLVPKLMNWSESGDKDRPAVWSHCLPRCIGIDENGNPTQADLVPKYSDLFDFGMKVIVRLSGIESGITDNEFIRFAANCLGVNYRVSLLELSTRVMGCLTVEDAIQIVYAAVDYKAYEDAVGNVDGRQGRPTTDTDSGSDASTPDKHPITDQPLAN